MEDFSITQNEFAVLTAYAKMKHEGGHKTLPQMATAMGVKFAPFKKVVDQLREKGFLVGHRKIILSDIGLEAYAKASDIVRKQVAEAEQHAAESTVAPDPVAAATPENMPRMASVPAAVSRDDRSLSEVVAAAHRVSADKLWDIIKNNIISIASKDHDPVTDAEVMHVLTVMNRYSLDPFVKQIYAFRHKGKLQVSVAIDGWVAVANRHDAFEGVEYEFPPMEEMVDTPAGKKCWSWVKATCHVAGRKPTVAYAFLDEWYAPSKYNDGTGNWEKYPTHRLKSKAYTLSVREGLGIALYDDADREQLVMADFEEVTMIERNTGSGADLLMSVERNSLLTDGVSPVEGEPAPGEPIATEE